ncbi:hypothetical protein P154DRAFT_623252 [Amniculicola lignicola CBS 123094]|uniref:Uncharacterized protein n=1 Tax=Amniculicola lignicola CBS 123094 TaxID=1392246 RepID=A0A6A5W679_9PLEO|nr:hypothetical protein P154DRAFT_623252 [Amniculicola lignicola CBS 123094]
MNNNTMPQSSKRKADALPEGEDVTASATSKRQKTVASPTSPLPSPLKAVPAKTRRRKHTQVDPVASPTPVSSSRLKAAPTKQNREMKRTHAAAKKAARIVAQNTAPIVASAAAVGNLNNAASTKDNSQRTPRSRVPAGPCPINWSQVKCTQSYQKDVYELRAPWLTSPKSFGEMVELWNEMHPDDKMGNQESIRKRFRRINEIVFKATGIYFVDSCMGIEKFVPKEHQKSGPKNVTLANKEDPNLDSKRQDDEDYDLSEPRMWELENQGVNMFFIYYKSEDDPEKSYLSFPLERFSHASTAITEIASESRRRRAGQAMEVDYPKKVVEHWLKCVGTAERIKFRLPFRIGTSEELSSSDLFQLYSFSIWMGSPMVADLVIDHWHSHFRRKALLEAGYRSGALSFNDIPTERMLHPLDFEPEDINRLWAETDVVDHGRTFWLDVIVNRGEEGVKKITNELSSYDGNFLGDLHARMMTDPAEDPTAMEQLPCARYHTHPNFGLACYRKHPNFPTDPVPLINRVAGVYPRKAVRLTMRGQDYLVVNNTDYSTSSFREIPLSAPEWNWPKVRAVYNLRGGDWLPKPTYFHDSDADEMGRFPSHPGWKNPDWKPPRQKEDEEMEEEEEEEEGLCDDEDEVEEEEDEEEWEGFFQRDPFKDRIVDGRVPHWTAWGRLARFGVVL